MTKFCIDSSVFLGMNSTDEITRISCKNFFIENVHAEILISFEQIGNCDNIIWSFAFELQSLYYPFMDLFHTEIPVKRLPFTENTFSYLSKNHSIDFSQRLNVAFAQERDTIIYSNHLELIDQFENVFRIPISLNEHKFSNQLEKCYQKSLNLRINTNLLK